MTASTGWSRLAYTLEQDDGGPLHCLEATRSGTDDEPIGVLPGTVARRSDLTARVADRGDHVLAVVHRGSVAGPVRLVGGLPRVLGSPM